MIERDIRGDVILLTALDSLDGRQARQLRELVADEVVAGRTRFVLDLSQLEFIDSSGLGALVWSHSRVAEAGGAMLLCGIGSRVRTLIALTRLDEVLSLRPTLPGALAELSTPRADHEP